MNPIPNSYGSDKPLSESELREAWSASARAAAAKSRHGRASRPASLTVKGKEKRKQLADEYRGARMRAKQFGKSGSSKSVRQEAVSQFQSKRKGWASKAKAARTFPKGERPHAVGYIDGKLKILGRKGKRGARKTYSTSMGRMIG